jgi:hypothetical protein
MPMNTRVIIGYNLFQQCVVNLCFVLLQHTGNREQRCDVSGGSNRSDQLFTHTRKCRKLSVNTTLVFAIPNGYKEEGKYLAFTYLLINFF